MLRALPLDPADPAAAAVVAASRRVALARQVHTDLVRDALAVRRRPLVRLLRLTRRHPRPAYFDIDDPTLELPRGVRPTAGGAAAARAGRSGQSDRCRPCRRSRSERRHRPGHRG